LPESLTGLSNWTPSGIPTPTTEPLAVSRWYVAVILADDVAKLLVVVPEAETACTVYVVDGRSRWVARHVAPSEDSLPATVRELSSFTETDVIGPPVAVTVTVVSGATEAVPLVGEIASETAGVAVVEGLEEAVDPPPPEAAVWAWEPPWHPLASSTAVSTAPAAQPLRA
jgi:hypothetical protein